MFFNNVCAHQAYHYQSADGRPQELNLKGDQNKLTLCGSLLQGRFAENQQGLQEVQTAFAYASPAPAPAAPLLGMQFQTQATPAAYGYPAAAAGYSAAGYGAAQYGAQPAAAQSQQYGYDAATTAYYQQYYAAAAAQGYPQQQQQQAYGAQNPYAAYYASMGMAVPGAPAAGAGGRSTTSLTVPNELVGRIIGKGGVSIKAIQEQSGAHVDIPPDTKTPTRTLTITGDMQQITACTQLINQKLVSRF